MDNTMNMNDRELVRYLTSMPVGRLVRYAKTHKITDLRVKNYIDGLMCCGTPINMYDFDLYAYPRVMCLDDCIDYYVHEGVINVKNMPYLADIVIILRLPNLLHYYEDVYSTIMSGSCLVEPLDAWLTTVDDDMKMRLKWLIEAC